MLVDATQCSDSLSEAVCMTKFKHIIKEAAPCRAGKVAPLRSYWISFIFSPLAFLLNRVLVLPRAAAFPARLPPALLWAEMPIYLYFRLEN